MKALKKYSSVIIFLLIASPIQAQSGVALSTGISVDLNNSRPFYMIPVSLQWKPFNHSNFFVEAIQNLGLNRLSHGDAYTTNPQLPEHVRLTQAMRSSSLSIGLGGGITLYTSKKNNQVVLNISFGISHENYVVEYREYDRKNYEVLNPDADRNFGGVYAAMSAMYFFNKTRRNLFLMSRIQTPTLTRQDRYQYSFKIIAPLEITFGYALFYGKSK